MSPNMSEYIKSFSSNSEVIVMVNKLWKLKNKDNDSVEYILRNCSNDNEDEVILKLEHEIDKLEQSQNKARGKRERKSSKKHKNKKSKKNKNNKSSKKYRNKKSRKTRK